MEKAALSASATVICMQSSSRTLRNMVLGATLTGPYVLHRSSNCCSKYMRGWDPTLIGEGHRGLHESQNSRVKSCEKSAGSPSSLHEPWEQRHQSRWLLRRGAVLPSVYSTACCMTSARQPHILACKCHFSMHAATTKRFFGYVASVRSSESTSASFRQAMCCGRLRRPKTVRGPLINRTKLKQ